MLSGKREYLSQRCVPSTHAGKLNDILSASRSIESPNQTGSISAQVKYLEKTSRYLASTKRDISAHQPTVFLNKFLRREDVPQGAINRIPYSCLKQELIQVVFLGLSLILMQGLGIYVSYILYLFDAFSQCRLGKVSRILLKTANLARDSLSEQSIGRG